MSKARSPRVGGPFWSELRSSSNDTSLITDPVATIQGAACGEGNCSGTSNQSRERVPLVVQWTEGTEKRDKHVPRAYMDLLTHCRDSPLCLRSKPFLASPYIKLAIILSLEVVPLHLSVVSFKLQPKTLQHFRASHLTSHGIALQLQTPHYVYLSLAPGTVPRFCHVHMSTRAPCSCWLPP
jgi:hypothetical protein